MPLGISRVLKPGNAGLAIYTCHMPKLTVRKHIGNPSFAASKWRKQDHETPLVLRLSNAMARFYLEDEKFGRTSGDIIVLPHVRMDLLFDPAPADLIRGLSRKGFAGTSAAKDIYEAYLEAHVRFEALLYSAGKVRHLMRTEPNPMVNFFSSERYGYYGYAEWSVDDAPFSPFQLKLAKPRGRNPLYTAAQLVTPARWRDMQRSAENGSYPEGELLELYRIRGKVGWRQLRTATIEASIISESLLRAYGLKTLKDNGFSKTKLSRLGDEMTFNNLLNIVLPLSLNKGELRRVQVAIDAVDRLRRIRNDLVHGNITEKEIEATQVEQGIDGAISLVRFLQTRIK